MSEGKNVKMNRSAQQRLGMRRLGASNCAKFHCPRAWKIKLLFSTNDQVRLSI